MITWHPATEPPPIDENNENNKEFSLSKDALLATSNGVDPFVIGFYDHGGHCWLSYRRGAIFTVNVTHWSELNEPEGEKI